LVIPSPKKEKTTLLTVVNDQHAASGPTDERRLYPCHRLDRDTSGVILFSRGKANQKRMMEAFRQRSVKKKYIALVQGKLRTRAGEIRNAIEDFDQKKFSRRPLLRFALTRYRVMESKRLFSVVEVLPVTGRTNQIRIHFKQIGHPLVGERKYAFGKDFTLKFRRTALHAAELVWPHPITKKIIKTVSPLAQDMEAFIAKN
jgi:23S rRNA pseudouridine1911/1915/1917 synthase